jgi:hypothetical protein
LVLLVPIPHFSVPVVIHAAQDQRCTTEDEMNLYGFVMNVLKGLSLTHFTRYVD